MYARLLSHAAQAGNTYFNCGEILTKSLKNKYFPKNFGFISKSNGISLRNKMVLTSVMFI
jgi:hypothetical protein